MSPPQLELLDAPFDLYQRYRLTGDIAKTLARTSGAALRVLDVGGSHADFWGRPHRPIAEFLPELRTFTLDLADLPLAGYVRGRGDALPFLDRTFELVCSLDVLEHVPAPTRACVLSQAVRVASRCVVLAAPFRSPEVERAESLVSDFIFRTCGYVQGQLREHREHGLPDLRTTVASLQSRGLTVRVFAYGSLWQWALMMIDKHAVQALAGSRRLETRLDRAYNELSFDHDRSAPHYRHFVLAAVRADDPVIAWAVRTFGAATLEEVEARPAPPRESTELLFDALAVHARNQALQVQFEPERRDAHVEDVEAHRQQAFEVLASMQAENARLAALMRAVERSPTFRVAAWARRVLRLSS